MTRTNGKTKTSKVTKNGRKPKVQLAPQYGMYNVAFQGPEKKDGNVLLFTTHKNNGKSFFRIGWWYVDESVDGLMMGKGFQLPATPESMESLKDGLEALEASLEG